MVNYEISYDNEKRFTKQRKKLNIKELKKLKNCIIKLMTEGPQTHYADNHIIDYNGRRFRSMDLSKPNRLTFQWTVDTIILFDCGNHLIEGNSYISTKSITE